MHCATTNEAPMKKFSFNFSSTNPTIKKKLRQLIEVRWERSEDFFGKEWTDGSSAQRVLCVEKETAWDVFPSKHGT